jgi:predicted small integral membrane protein
MSLPPHEHARRGFLPIETNAFDRVFIGVVLFVAINLLWMRFLEPYLSLYVGAAIAVVIGWLIVRYG